MASTMRVAVALCAVAITGATAARKYNTQAQAVSGKINVHVVPHTHDDVGWLKTPDQYFWGGNFSIQNVGVQYVIDSVIDALRKNPDRKFIYVEQAFFDMWWRHADFADQEAISQFVANGQLEFINGGWTMHDEASPSYVEMIDQTTLGVRIIKSRFNVVPKVTWQIDPFGHSGTQSSMLTAASGYEGLYFGRADYQDRQNRINTSSTEYMWRASPSQPGLQHLTGLMQGYGPPIGGFDWDIRNGGFEPIIDDIESAEYNVPGWIDQAVHAAQAMANYTRTAPDGTVHVMWTMGSDFQYIAAQSYFSNLDRLVHYINLDGRINAFYSTPSIYSEAKLAQAATGQVTFPVTAYSDLFPYGDSAHSYWSGYFTSRASLKGYVRESTNYLQCARQAQVYAGGATANVDDAANGLFGTERGAGTLTHHDGVSGTSKQHVAYAYARTLAMGRAVTDQANSAAFSSLTGYTGTPFVACDLANATICGATESATSPTAVLVWNSRGQALGGVHIRVSVGLPSGVVSYTVTSPQGTPVLAQLAPATTADNDLRTTYYGGSNAPVAWLVFPADIPASGYSTYVIAPSATAAGAPFTALSKPARHVEAGAQASNRNVRGGDSTMTNGVVTLVFDGNSGAIKSWSSTAVTNPVPFTQTWMWWNASTGNNVLSNQASGAYIFRPNNTIANAVSSNSIVNTFINGPVVWEARQAIGPWITQVIRMFSNRSDVEFEWTVGPVDIKDGMGKEVIARYSVAGMATNATWITDSNGRDMYTRVRNWRPTWNYTVTEPVAGNYYPVNTRISTSDIDTGLTMNVVTDRTQAGSSMVDGSVELMVQRRLTADDRRGVGEPLSEPGLDFTGKGVIIRGIHRVTFDASPVAASVTGRSIMQAALFPPRPSFASLASGTVPATWVASIKGSASGLSAPLPPNVHLLTVHSHSSTQLLLRLAHLYSVGEDPGMAANVTVGLTNLFSGFTINTVQETTLIANVPLTDLVARRLQLAKQWGLENPEVASLNLPGLPALSAFRGIEEPPAGAALSITLGPMEIRTFLCDTSPQGL